jgi:hypothetical protein
MTKLDAHHKRIIVKMKANHEERMAIMRADRGETKAYPEKREAAPEEIRSESDYQEVPKKEVALKYFFELKKRHEDSNLSVGRPQKSKERTQDNGESREKVGRGC